jgi:hypothetical protein
MVDLTESLAPLAPEEATRLTDFARACKAAARAVLLYPTGHPAIAATLGRLVQLTSEASLPGPLHVTVTPDSLLLDGRAPARADGAITELAALLHDHLVGGLTVHPGGDLESWRSFLLLLGRSPDAIRAEGGIARLWTTMAGRHLELREIDYAGVLRERTGGESATWDRIVAGCLEGDALALDEEALGALLGIAGSAEWLREIMSTLEVRAGGESGGGIDAQASALVRMMRGIVDAVSSREPERLDPVLTNVATAIGHLSPDMMLALLSRGASANSGAGEGAPQLVGAVVSRMSETTIAQFVAHNVIENSPIDRLAQAFQTLVRDGEERERMLALANVDVANSPLGQTEGFEEVWDHVAQKLLTSYSDEPYVSDVYGRELSTARTQAIQVEQVSDDPPERVSAWLSTVATTALRALDLTLLLDLLRIEADDGRWSDLMPPVVSLLEDQLLVGDFDAASQLIDVLVRVGAGDASKARRQSALIAIDRLVAGSMMRHIVTHLGTIDDEQFERVKAFCISIGEVVVRPLAEALSTEDNNRTRERLTAILIGFGASGRRTVERLKSSPNAAVRRTAIYLLRQFGGSDALPDLTELLDDNEPLVQREAVRAILHISTDRAYQVLEKALTSGTGRSRDAIMHAVSALRDERAAPLFVHILRHIDHRGPLSGIYVRAIESLGVLRDPEGIEPLKEVLFRGEWWAPRRTAGVARDGGGGARPHRHVGCAGRARGRRAARTAWRPQGGALSCDGRAGASGARVEAIREGERRERSCLRRRDNKSPKSCSAASPPPCARRSSTPPVIPSSRAISTGCPRPFSSCTRWSPRS